MRLTGSLIVATLLLVLGASAAQTQRTAAVEIPKTWDDAEIARHEIPLADPAASPRHVSSDYYYRIPYGPSTRAIRCMHQVTNHLATWTG